MNLRENISVALCSFNGEKYIEEQLKSIITQTSRPDEIVIVDDVSEDSTPDIVSSFTNSCPVKVTFTRNERRLGPVKNFEKAINIASGDYVFLSDQDDLWIPEKIEKTLALIQKVETEKGKDNPILAHSDLRVVNEQLQVINPSYMHHKKISHRSTYQLEALLVQNFVTGCTVCINKKMKEIALPFPEKAMMHDWWLALLACALGQIVFHPEPLILYRQHGHNVVGAVNYFSSKRIKRLFQPQVVDKTIAEIYFQACALKERIKSLEYGNIEIVGSWIASLEQNPWAAVQYALKNHILKQNSLHNLFFLFSVLRGGYRKYIK